VSNSASVAKIYNATGSLLFETKAFSSSFKNTPGRASVVVVNLKVEG
jgi:hypothetical protein